MRAETDLNKLAEVAYSAGAGNQYHEIIKYIFPKPPEQSVLEMAIHL